MLVCVAPAALLLVPVSFVVCVALASLVTADVRLASAELTSETPDETADETLAGIDVGTGRMVVAPASLQISSVRAVVSGHVSCRSRWIDLEFAQVLSGFETVAEGEEHWSRGFRGWGRKTAEGERKSGGLLRESSVEQACRMQGVAEARIAAWPRVHWQL